jgi:predicted hydrocarbon binding protein
MIMNATQVQPERIPLNYFAPKSYVRSESKSGLMSTPQGKRLIAIPEMLIDSIHETLLAEAGEAASMAFYTFGSSWGKSFYDRARKEIEVYYQTAIAQMNAPEFFAIMQELWGVHGLGRIMVDFSNAKEGLLLVTIENSGISKINPNSESKSFSVEAGFLAGWFSTFTHKDLSACATNWTLNSKRTEYLIGAKSQIEQIESSMLSKAMRTSTILSKIGHYV